MWVAYWFVMSVSGGAGIKEGESLIVFIDVVAMEGRGDHLEEALAEHAHNGTFVREFRICEAAGDGEVGLATAILVGHDVEGGLEGEAAVLGFEGEVFLLLDLGIEEHEVVGATKGAVLHGDLGVEVQLTAFHGAAEHLDEEWGEGGEVYVAQMELEGHIVAVVDASIIDGFQLAILAQVGREEDVVEVGGLEILALDLEFINLILKGHGGFGEVEIVDGTVLQEEVVDGVFAALALAEGVYEIIEIELLSALHDMDYGVLDGEVFDVQSASQKVYDGDAEGEVIDGGEDIGAVLLVDGGIGE